MAGFLDWIAEHHPPKCGAAPNGILRAIQMAGAGGISRRELGSLFDLSPQLLTRLLAAYVGVGMVAANREDGGLVFRSLWGSDSNVNR
jgi:hypothetical protein